ncbi:MAG: gamma-mobile-trio recombinase GmtY [Sulfuritalea sp.]|nr:gamma-mobile-trio recombinase GmtY [Sulfuritalea sp.]
MAFSVVRGRIFTDATGASIEMPVLMSAEGPVRPLIDYCLTVRRSISWQRKFVRANKLFLEYLEQNAIQGEEEWRLFRNFSNTLRIGTIDPETQEDPSGLYWTGIGVRDANFMINQLSDFFEWLSDPERSPRAGKFNPAYAGNRYDQRIDEKAYQFRRNKAFLGHSWATESKRRARLIRGEQPPKVFAKRPPMFPEDRFAELLSVGFKVAGRYDYRGILITLMLFGGGLRVSEPFHTYMADVHPHWEDPAQAFVAVHHPSLGYAPNDWTNRSGQRGSRQEYLSQEFGLVPRHRLDSKLAAGWKHPALDDKWYMQVHWLPDGNGYEFGQWFMQVWRLYMEQIQGIPRNHPYAFINTDQNCGGIYTIDQYNKALKNAVERIGLIFGKAYGTTAHGFRHAYAQRARRGGIDPIIIQRIMHHCSPESQQVYTQPEVHEQMAAIRNAAEVLRQNHSQLPAPRTLLSELMI